MIDRLPDLKRLLREMTHWSKHHPDDGTRKLINRWLQLAASTETDVEILIEEAKNIGVRNPAFPDDLVGWLDDDFDDDEADEDDDS